MTTVGSLPLPDDDSMSIEVPSEWYFKESFTLLAPDGQANVILSSEPVDPSLTTLEYATVQTDLLEAEFPGYSSRSGLEDFVFASGQVGMLHEFTWAPPERTQITQAQLYFVRGGRGRTATATAEEEHFHDVRGVLLRALQSIRLIDPAGSTTRP